MGLIQNDLGLAGYVREVGADMDQGNPLRARRLDGLLWLLPPFLLDERVFSFALVRSMAVTDS